MMHLNCRGSISVGLNGSWMAADRDLHSAAPACVSCGYRYAVRLSSSSEMATQAFVDSAVMGSSSSRVRRACEGFFSAWFAPYRPPPRGLPVGWGTRFRVAGE